ncbi:MAG: hypothetical protein Q9217_002417 [Psora testacea]
MPTSQNRQTSKDISRDNAKQAAGEALSNGTSPHGIGASVNSLGVHPIPKENTRAPTSNGAEGDVSGRTLGVINGTSPTPTPTLNGLVQTRKRSRSGTRIIRPSLDTERVRRRGPDDLDGKAVEKVKLHEYVYRDLRHWAAKVHDIERRGILLDEKRNDRILNLKLRGITADEESEIAHIKKIDDYPVTPLVNPAAIYGPGYGQYGNITNRPPSRQPGIIFPAHRPRVGGRRARELRIPRRELKKHADQLEELVPIRLDIEWEKVRLRDSFTWNLHDRIVPMDLFAQQLVEDFGLSLETCEGLVRQVLANIQEQVQDYFPHAFVDDGPEDPHLPYTAYKDDEMRITIKLNITIGQHTLVDQFEWDINNSNDAPELFARQMAKDLSLSGEFATAIAHDIREQCQLFTRSLYIIGHPFDGRPVTDQDLQAGMQPSPMPSAFRPYQAAKEYSPYLYELNEADLERTELSLSREERRQKRSVNRRGGPALPDLKDRRRTIRTSVVSSIIPGAAETLEDSRIFKRVVTASGKAKRPGYAHKDGLEDSDESESEDSTPGSPVIPSHLLSGTARTRGMRGAATVAQAAMKGAALARSATPESSNLHHHETRTSGRRRDYREESIDNTPPSLVVKLKVPSQRLRQLLREQRTRSKPIPLDSPQRRSQSETPGQSTPKPGAMGPPTTPGHQHHNHQQHASPPHHRDVNPLHPHAAQLGRVDAKGGPPTIQNPAPPPPNWLIAALSRLQQSYPNDRFEGAMRYLAVSRETDLPVHNVTLKPNEPPPDNVKMMFYPRIKCLDCPGKLYTPGPEACVTNFEVHLKNKVHRERVEERVRKGGKDLMER